MAAPPSTRIVWKGAISFGLVHIPIGLYSATADSRPKFNLIDTKSMSPVGNRQVSKSTGEAVTKEEVGKGIKVDESQYVVLTKDEIRAALPKTTQTIEIECFVDASEIPSVFFEKPYYTAPTGRSAKAFILLRETLRRTGKVGVGRVVISTKQHLAALIPLQKGLALNLLRWASEVRESPPAATMDPGDSAPSDREFQMAEQLVKEQSDVWHPEAFRDEFSQKIEELVLAKTKVGDLTTIRPLEGEDVAPAGAELLDLTELLRRSLQVKVPEKRKEPSKTAHGSAAKRERAEATGDSRPRKTKPPAPGRKRGAT